MKAKHLLLVPVSWFLVCGGFAANMPENEKAIVWFAAIMDGTWRELPQKELDEAKLVLDNSHKWASELLSDSFNVYKGGLLMERRGFMGAGTSPDKLVTEVQETTSGRRVVVYETMQNFVVCLDEATNIVSNTRTALVETRTRLDNLFSIKAKAVIDGVIASSLEHVAEAALQDGATNLISMSTVRIGAIARWSDRVELLRAGNRTFVNIHKAYSAESESSKAPTAPFEQGLDWYSLETRTRLGANR